MRQNSRLTLAVFLLPLLAMPPVVAQKKPALSEIERARTAAPRLISEHASVYVLRDGSYELAEQGTNGFTCFVMYENDPRAIYPTCLDPEWTRCEFPRYRKEAELRHRGWSEEKIEADDHAGEFPAPEHAGIAYMASPMMRGMFDVVKNGRIQPHVMIYARGATNAQLGVRDINEARRLHIPFVALEGRPNAHIISPLMTYSDGSRFLDER